MQKFILFIAFSFLSFTAYSNEYKLAETEAFFTAPSTIVFQTGIICSIPCLNFNLPKGPHGGTPVWPDFRIDKRSKQFSEYLKEVMSYGKTNNQILYSNKIIKGFKVAEIASTGEAVFDFVGGGSGTATLETREIVFDFSEYIISCSMTSSSKDHKIYLNTLIELCNSIRVKLD